MYIAEQVSPPSYPTPGEVTFSGWSASGTLRDMRDALNWEASGHSPQYASWFYTYWENATTTFNQQDLHNAISVDIASAHVPPIVITMTSALPNWSNGTVVHAIAIVGYDDATATYTYLDTCGIRCGSNSNGGVHTVDQTTLYNGIKNVGGPGGIVW